MPQEVEYQTLTCNPVWRVWRRYSRWSAAADEAEQLDCPWIIRDNIGNVIAFGDANGITACKWPDAARDLGR